MRSALALTGCTALLLAPAASAETAGAPRPRAAISVTPAQIALAPPGTSRITVRNDGAEQVVVDVMRRSVEPSTTASAWLEVAPARLALRPGASAPLTVRVRRPDRAEPGAHQALVVLTTRALRSGHVNVRMRLGVRIRMRVPGRVVRHIAFGSLRVHRARNVWRMRVSIANRGNVTVWLGKRVRASLVRRGREVARLTAVARRALRPGARTLLTLRYGGRARGSLTAIVRIRLDVAVFERRYRLRL